METDAHIFEDEVCQFFAIENGNLLLGVFDGKNINVYRSSILYLKGAI